MDIASGIQEGSLRHRQIEWIVSGKLNIAIH
jgi:hypothetical protein